MLGLVSPSATPSNATATPAPNGDSFSRVMEQHRSNPQAGTALIASGETAGPVERKVKNPVFGTQGKHNASLLIVSGQHSTRSAESWSNRPAFGFGLGRSDNGGQPPQYFLGVRASVGDPPKTRLTVSAERVTGDQAIVGRAVPTLTTVTSFPPQVNLQGKVGRDDVTIDAGATVSPAGVIFINPSIGVAMAGTIGTADLKSSQNVVVGSASQGGFLIWNKRLGGKDDMRVLQRQGLTASEIERAMSRPIPSVDKNAPALLTTSMTVGRTETVKGRSAAPMSVTDTATFPVKPDQIPPEYKTIIDKVVALQALPDKNKLKTYLAALQASPKLMKGFAQWEQGMLDKHVRAAGGRITWSDMMKQASLSQPQPARPQPARPEPARPEPAPTAPGGDNMLLGGLKTLWYFMQGVQKLTSPGGV